MKIATAAGVLLLVFVSACGQGCGSCGCPLPYCGDQSVYVADSGKTFNLEVGQSIAIHIPTGNPIFARSSDPSVLKQVDTVRPDNYTWPTAGRPTPISWAAGFVAEKEGSATIDFGYEDCGEALNAACSSEVTVNVVQFPKVHTNIVISLPQSANPGVPRTSVRLRPGETVRITVPEFMLGPAQSFKIEIETPDLVEWVVMPAVFPSELLKGAVKALSPGTAHIVVDVCDSGKTACGMYWELDLTIAA